MTPQLQAIKEQYINSAREITDDVIRQLRLPYGEDFELQYKFYLLRGAWRVSLCMLKSKHEWHAVGHCGSFANREDALRETYRLNGWGEPKPRK